MTTAAAPDGCSSTAVGWGGNLRPAVRPVNTFGVDESASRCTPSACDSAFGRGGKECGDGVLVMVPLARYHGRMFPPNRRTMVHP